MRLEQVKLILTKFAKKVIAEARNNLKKSGKDVTGGLSNSLAYNFSESEQEFILQFLGEKYGKESVATYYGDTKDNLRQSIVDRFMDANDGLRFFVGNPKTGGYGLTLTSSHTVVYYSNDYSLEVRLQSEDRAHRIGQTSKVTYVDLMADHTIDEKIVKSLNAKIDLASQVMGEDPKKILFE